MKHQTAFWFKFMGLIACSFVLIFQADFSGRAAGPWYVAPEGEDANSCQSPGDPCATINGALGKAAAGDTIYVAGGTYTAGDEQVSDVVILNKHVTLLGGWDSTFTVRDSETIIDGRDTQRGVKITDGVVAVIENLSIINGSAWSYAGGLFNNNGSLTLRDSTVSDNFGWYDGGGIYNNNGIMILERVIVENNTVGTSGKSGGIFNYYGTMSIDNCLVSDNFALREESSSGGIFTDHGSIYINNTIVRDNIGSSAGIRNESGSMTIVNSAIIRNRGFTGGIFNNGTMEITNVTISNNIGGGNGGGIFNNSVLNIYNSTVSQNVAYWDGGGIYSNRITITLQNTILAGNTAGRFGRDCRGTIGTTTYSLVGNPAGCTYTPGTGDITNVDPKLGSLLVPFGYQPLLTGSPAIDAGNPMGCTDHLGNPLEIDQRGAERVGICDMGAYEYLNPDSIDRIIAFSGFLQHAPPNYPFSLRLQAVVVDNIGSPVSGAVVTFSAPESGPSGIFGDSGVFTTTALTDLSGVVTAPIFTANGVRGNYVITATVSGILTPTIFTLGNSAWYVSKNGDDLADCISAETPCATINGALTKGSSLESETVFITSGIYTRDIGDEVVLITKNVTLSGGWDESFTTKDGFSILDGEFSRRSISVLCAQARIENFVLRNGITTYGGGIYNYRGTVTLSQSEISGSLSIYEGGSIYNRGEMTVANSTIHSNNGYILNEYGNLIINNSTITKNSGGGILNHGLLLIYSSTIAKNTYGIDNYNGTTRMQNSILAGNYDGVPKDFMGNLFSRYNLIQDTSLTAFLSSTGDLLNVDPKLLLFTGLPGFYPIFPNSPAFDHGDPDGCKDQLGNLLDKDQRGVARFGRCDIGAYEYDPVNDSVELSFIPMTSRAWECLVGICGRVSVNGIHQQGVTLELRWYSGSSWFTRGTTTTDSNGVFSFTNVYSLYPGQIYYVLYRNTEGTPGRLWVWGTRPLTSYQENSNVMIGDFDIADIVLQSPPNNSTVALPYTFQWARRPATIGDSYEFNLYDPLDGDPWFYTAPLGYVDSYTLSSLPPGFSTKTPYIWEMWVYSADGGYGISNSYGVVTFSNTGSSLMQMEPARPKPETDRELWLGR